MSYLAKKFPKMSYISVSTRLTTHKNSISILWIQFLLPVCFSTQETDNAISSFVVMKPTPRTKPSWLKRAKHNCFLSKLALWKGKRRRLVRSYCFYWPTTDLSTLTIWSWDTRFPYWSHDCLLISRFLTI